MKDSAPLSSSSLVGANALAAPSKGRRSLAGRALRLGGAAAILAACGGTVDVAAEPPKDAPDSGATPGAGDPPDAGTSGPTSSCPRGEWCWLNPQPAGEPLSGIWSSNWDDIWAVSVYGTVLRYDGRSWRSAGRPTGGASAMGIYGTAKDDVWITLKDGGFAHYDGQAWSVLPSNVVTRTMWGKDKDVFMVGLEGDITRRQNGKWIGQTVPDGIGPFVDIWGASLSDVYALAKGGEIIHFDGATWSLVTGRPSRPADARPIALWGVSSTDMGVVWRTENAIVFERFDGSRWTRAYERVDEKDMHESCQWQPSISHLLFINGYRPSVVADNYEIIVFDASLSGCLWRADREEARVERTNNYNRVVALADSSSGLWGVGESGVITNNGAPIDAQPRDDVLRLATTAPNDVWAITSSNVAPLLHWDGIGVASLAPFKTDGKSVDIAAIAKDDVWVVGHGRGGPESDTSPRYRVAHFDGSRWTEELFEPGALHAVWARAHDDVWAVGTQGRVQRFDGTAWRVFPGVPPEEQISSVSGTASDDVWLTGCRIGEGWACDLHVAYHWNGSTLERRTIPLKQGGRLLNVKAIARNEVWFYNGSHVVRWDGASFMDWSFGGTLVDVWGSGPSDVWFVGYGDHGLRSRILRWDGHALTQDIGDAVPGTGLNAVTGNGPHDIWIGGARGAILNSAGY